MRIGDRITGGEPLRLQSRAISPFESRCLHPGWRARIPPGEKIKQSARSFDDAHLVQTMTIAQCEAQFGRGAEADPQHIGAGSVDDLDNLLLLLRGEIAVVKA